MNILGYHFQGPFAHNLSFDDDFRCVYAIVSNRTTLIDVGETSSINDRLSSHERRPCWLRNGGATIELYVLVESNQNRRLQIESFIRNSTDPVCGVR